MRVVRVSIANTSVDPRIRRQAALGNVAHFPPFLQVLQARELPDPGLVWPAQHVPR